MYIVFEGIIGTGKSTQSKKIHKYLKKKFPNKEVIWTREPGGTEIAEAIRKVVQGTNFDEEMDPICDQYLYAASRAQALRKVVKPALDMKGIVISDRNFTTSLANQGYSIGIKKALQINKAAIEGFIPDVVIHLKLDPEVSVTRTSDKKGDKWEKKGLDFHKEMAKRYKEISKIKGICKKWIDVDASGNTTTVYNKLLKELDKIF